MSAPSPASAAARTAHCASTSSVVRTRRLPLTRISKVRGVLWRPISFSVISKVNNRLDGLFRVASSMRQYHHVPLFRFLMLVTAGSVEGRWFPLRSPVKGRSKAGWRRSAACLVRFLFAVLCSGPDGLLPSRF